MILPESSAIASVSALKVEPISYTPVVSRLMRVGIDAPRADCWGRSPAPTPSR